MVSLISVMRTKNEIICIKIIKTIGAITNRRINGEGESIRINSIL
jgi:hypothetical protein